MRSSDLRSRATPRWLRRSRRGRFAVLLATPPAAAPGPGRDRTGLPDRRADLLVELRRSFARKARTVSCANWSASHPPTIVAAIEQPAPVPGLARSAHPRALPSRPGSVVIGGHRRRRGPRLVPPGTATNPLDTCRSRSHCSSSTPASRPDRWAGTDRALRGKVKPILTGGFVPRPDASLADPVSTTTSRGRSRAARHYTGAGAGVAGGQEPAHRCLAATP